MKFQILHFHYLGNATLGSNTPLTITKLGNYNFVPFWNPAEPNDCCDPGIDSQENYAQHVGTGRLNDLPNGNNLAGVLEIINPNSKSYLVTLTSYLGLSDRAVHTLIIDPTLQVRGQMKN